MAENAPSKLLNPQTLARLMAQPLLSRFPMEGTISGQHKSPHRGSSVEFAEYRNYVPGDDIRRLDWRVFGRTDRFYLKEFEAETNLRCYLAVDTSASMNFGTEGNTKLDLAKRMAATLAYLVVHQGDAAGLLTVAKKTELEIPPKRNPAHLRLILDTLDKTEAKGETGLIPALHDLAEKIRPRALVIVLSDFFCDLEELLKAFQHLRFRKHDLAVFQLLDRQEIDFKFDRPIRFLDMESTLNIVTEPEIVREQYLKSLNAFLDRLKTGCHEFKADYRLVTSDQNPEKVLSDFLGDRARIASFS